MARKKCGRVRSRRMEADEYSALEALWCIRVARRGDVFDRIRSNRSSLNTEFLDVLGLTRYEPLLLSMEDVARDLSQREARLSSRAALGGVLAQNAQWIAEELDLSDVDRRLLEFGALLGSRSSLAGALDAAKVRTIRGLADVLSLLLDVPAADIAEALRPRAPLLACGLMKLQEEAYWSGGEPMELAQPLRQLIFRECRSVQDLVDPFIHACPSPTLGRDDFRHVAGELDTIRRVLAAALDEGRAGVNVLLHGPPGCGKTELARLIAQEMGARLHGVSTRDEHGDGIASDARFAAYLFCQRLVRGKGKAVVCFDELEDVFPDRWSSRGGRSKGSGRLKAWTNRALEENPAPTIWIGNTVDHIDPAFLRRFGLIVELRSPPQSMRRALLDELLAPHGVTEGARETWAEDRRLTPAVLKSAAEVLALAAPTSAPEAERVVHRTFEGYFRAQGEPVRRRGYRRSTKTYDLRFTNTPTDLVSLRDALLARGEGTVCLYGPPGTGKTAYVDHVARSADRPLVHKHASDLLDCYVGGTEQNIAAAFREAEEENAILFIDEGDSFLQDRRRAKVSWEVTQVNELLVQMEQFRGIFFCATNLIDDLDRAALRRFAVKVHFDWLRPEQSAALLAELLAELGGASRVPANSRRRLERLGRVTPGDMAAVARQIKLMGVDANAESFVTRLEEDVRLRDVGGVRIGF